MSAVSRSRHASASQPLIILPWVSYLLPFRSRVVYLCSGFWFSRLFHFNRSLLGNGFRLRLRGVVLDIISHLFCARGGYLSDLEFGRSGFHRIVGELFLRGGFDFAGGERLSQFGK